MVKYIKNKAFIYVIQQLYFSRTNSIFWNRTKKFRKCFSCFHVHITPNQHHGAESLTNSWFFPWNLDSFNEVVYHPTPNSFKIHEYLFFYPRAGNSSGSKANTRQTGHVRCSFNQHWIHCGGKKERICVNEKNRRFIAIKHFNYRLIWSLLGYLPVVSGLR